MPIGQTITVVNKSGKIVSTSKQLVNVWKEAKAAYRERKAELQSTRTADFEEKKARKAIKHVTLEDDDVRSHTSSRASRSNPHRSKSHRHGESERPQLERGYTDSFCANDNVNDGHGERPHKPRRSRTMHDVDIAGAESHNRELVRRHTDGEGLAVQPVRRHSTPHTSHSKRDSIDMDLAYGDLPPPLPVARHNEEEEVREQMTKLQLLLQEANCLQYSVTSMIEHLQKNPDALAAVALTLAEISNLASKMAPGALMAMKGSFPAAIALLASPQFLIAAGAGVGITIVMLGGYKIIKRIKNKKELEREEAEPVELQELEVDLSRIEQWRRGIADAHDGSAGTSVDGEFITPGASQRLIAEGRLKPEDLKSSASKGKKKKDRSGEKEDKKSREVRRRRESRDDGGSTKEKLEGKRKKAVGGLKMLFQGHSA
ncbi:hypothetical protein EJ08DRAFT_693763 [Tothia fuscella]|uniref:Uncharacterized protein n=1 Tax=Tothia fuscella TaxID=1048955 RepID=A0A9P4NYR6_9PEZI|nr:hypothetical protein EJ08DRAFT_693763 [Tothia fuscella]